MPRRAIGIGLALGAATISGFSVFLNGYAVRAFGDATLYTTAKNVLAALLLLAIAIGASRAAGARVRVPRARRERVGLVAVGVIGGGIPFLLFFEGLARTASSDAAFIHKTLILWVAVGAIVALRERFTLVHGVGIGVLMAGQLLATSGVGAPTADVASLMILAATLLWAVEVIVAKALLRTVAPATLAATRMGIGCLVLVAFTVASGDLALLASVSAAGWAWVAVTGVVLAAYVTTWYAALARAQAIDVSAVLVFGAVVTGMLDAGIRGATIASSFGGLVLITLGAAAFALLSLRASRPASR